MHINPCMNNSMRTHPNSNPKWIVPHKARWWIEVLKCNTSSLPLCDVDPLHQAQIDSVNVIQEQNLPGAKFLMWKFSAEICKNGVEWWSFMVSQCVLKGIPILLCCWVYSREMHLSFGGAWMLLSAINGCQESWVHLIIPDLPELQAPVLVTEVMIIVTFQDDFVLRREATYFGYSESEEMR